MSDPISTPAEPDVEVPEEVKKEKGLWEKTRKSLIERLNNWEDQRTWNEFYQTYWRLIFSVASKAGAGRTVWPMPMAPVTKRGTPTGDTKRRKSLW